MYISMHSLEITFNAESCDLSIMNSRETADTNNKGLYVISSQTQEKEVVGTIKN